MSEKSIDNQRKLLAFAALVEVGTGLATIIAPAMVVALLIGTDIPGVAAVLARCFGIALVALGLGCWPVRQRPEDRRPAFRAMLAYNVLIALYLAYIGALGHLRGPLLWPAVALHAATALLLMWTCHGAASEATGK